MNVMLWVVTPLSIASLLYGVLSIGYFFAQGRPAMSLVFLGYTLANIGLIWDALSIPPTH